MLEAAALTGNMGAQVPCIEHHNLSELGDASENYIGEEDRVEPVPGLIDAGVVRLICAKDGHDDKEQEQEPTDYPRRGQACSAEE